MTHHARRGDIWYRLMILIGQNKGKLGREPPLSPLAPCPGALLCFGCARPRKLSCALLRHVTGLKVSYTHSTLDDE